MFENEVALQVDGTAHTRGMFKDRQLYGPIKRDMQFNLTAWQAGAKVVRVLYPDLEHPELQEQLQLGGRYRGAPCWPLAAAVPRLP